MILEVKNLQQLLLTMNLHHPVEIAERQNIYIFHQVAVGKIYLCKKCATLSLHIYDL